MTTLLEVGAGRIVLRNTAGDTVFDSDERLFQATDKKTGSITVGSWQGSYTQTGGHADANRDFKYNLQAINAHADTVVGSFSVAASDGNGLAGKGWFSANGTYVHYNNAYTIGIGQGYGFAAFTFTAEGGFLKLHERIWLRSHAVETGFSTHTLQAVTFNWHVYCGSFV